MTDAQEAANNLPQLHCMVQSWNIVRCGNEENIAARLCPCIDHYAIFLRIIADDSFAPQSLVDNALEELPSQEKCRDRLIRNPINPMHDPVLQHHRWNIRTFRRLQ